jgi:hypothetical protein
MHRTDLIRTPVGALLALGLAAPGMALAYGNKDAIRDCESRVKSEYNLSDLRDAQAERLMDSEHHYKVQGIAKVDGDKQPWTCEVKNRHVTAAEYSGPKPKGMDGAQKLAVGAAAVIAAGLIASEVSKGNDSTETKESPKGKYSTSKYDATTTLRCSLNKPTHDKHCAAGIHRSSSGSASIRITTPVGTERTLKFDKDNVTTPNGGNLDWGKQGDEWYIGIDDREFYIVPDVAVYGD